MIKKYKQKPVIIKAAQYLGSNINEITEFVGDVLLKYNNNTLGIPILDGIVKANIGDYIIKGVIGKIYLCKPNIFKQTYDEV
jgi:hypothetical protein